MDERRGVHELERLGEVEHGFAIVARPEARRQEDQRGPEKLSGGLEDMLDRRLERRMSAATDGEQASLQLLELRLNRCIERRARHRSHELSLWARTASDAEPAGAAGDAASGSSR